MASTRECARDRVQRLLRSEARRHWKENPLLVGGDEVYQPVKDRTEAEGWSETEEGSDNEKDVRD